MFLRQFSPRRRRRQHHHIEQLEWFFFYGSLMEHYVNFRRYLRHQALAIEPAWMPGALVHLPAGYPALLRRPAGYEGFLISGELMCFRNTRRMIALLDRLEDYRPESPRLSLYIRRRGEAYRFSQTRERLMGVRTWYYQMPRAALECYDGLEIPLPCGSWKHYAPIPAPVLHHDDQFWPGCHWSATAGRFSPYRGVACPDLICQSSCAHPERCPFAPDPSRRFTKI